MNQAEAKIRIDELKAVLWENSRKYYVENAPTMSDYDYDQLMHELERLEAAYPEFACRPENLAHRHPRVIWGVEREVLCLGNDRAVKFINQ